MIAAPTLAKTTEVNAEIATVGLTEAQARDNFAKLIWAAAAMGGGHDRPP